MITHYELWVDGEFQCSYYSLVSILVYAEMIDVDVYSDKVTIKNVEGEIW